MRRLLSLSILLALAAISAVSLGSATAGEATTIHRDEFGIPHIFAPTVEDAAFAVGYAQAEDNFARLEDNFIRATGRRAEVDGEGAVVEDRLNRVLEIPRLAREEHARLDPGMRALVDGFVAGINYWMEKHPGAGRAFFSQRRCRCASM